MSLEELKQVLVTLSPGERSELREHLQAIEENISVEELRRMNSALDAEVEDPSPGLSVEDARASLLSLQPGDAP